MTTTIRAIYQNGIFKPLEPINLNNNTSVELIVSTDVFDSTKQRPSGLCAGEFVVPDDFDAPLPENIVREFE